MSLRTSACDLPQKLHIVMLVGRAMLNKKFQLTNCKSSSACYAKDFTPKNKKPEQIPVPAFSMIANGASIALNRRNANGRRTTARGARSKKTHGATGRRRDENPHRPHPRA